ncbi:MAG: hypothetical protein HFH62_04520 [Lachnospiraceae bacterium]|nr:hypothetical protein [Lachnospiraceae bacterium]
MMQGKGIRVGRVSSVDYRAATVDVIFADEEDSVRRGLPILSEEYRMPGINDMVVVIFQSNSGAREQGYVVGTPFRRANVPENCGKGAYYKRFSDTAYMEYDPESDTLTINAGKVVVRNLEEG